MVDSVTSNASGGDIGHRPVCAYSKQLIAGIPAIENNIIYDMFWGEPMVCFGGMQQTPPI